MNNEIIKHTLIDSFETLKDLWAGNEESLSTCIVEFSKYDSSIALDMWSYLLNTNIDVISDSLKAPKLTTDFLHKLHLKYRDSNIDYYYGECKIINDHFLPFIDNHEIILYLWFGSTINAGFQGVYKEFSPIILACLFLSGKSKLVYKVLHCLIDNSNMQDVSIGQLLEEVRKYVNIIFGHDLERKYRLDNATKEVLISVSSSCNNSMKRAELSIGLLSIIEDNETMLEKDKTYFDLLKRTEEMERQIEKLELYIKENSESC